MPYQHGVSIYTQAFPDENALVFTPDGVKGEDAGEALQAALYRVADERRCGVLYVAEGTYSLTQTIHIPRSVRLIGFGNKRPLFVLPANTPGFGGEPSDGNSAGSGGVEGGAAGYPGAKCLFWFTGNRPTAEQSPQDASAGTFYSALSNVDIRIGEGNPYAVCARAHFAQHCFISHCDFHIGDGLAGLLEVGNEMENLAFYGGRYGILCHQTSPSWPFALLDSTFTSQKEAAIASYDTGLTLFRVRVSGAPAAILPLERGNWEKTYLEDCVFEDISGPAIQFDLENNGFASVNIRRLYCKNVPTLVKMRESGKELAVSEEMYQVTRYIHGAVTADMAAESEMSDILETEPLETWPAASASDIVPLPSMDEWVSVKTFGAAGDGETDDTEALRQAAASGKAVFFPEGSYLATDAITLAAGTQLIGMNPISTQIILIDDTPAFAGFGTPLPLLETSRGFNLINGIGIDTAGKNPRAVGCKWLASEKSYMNDVKFVGGHGLLSGWGSIYNASRTADGNPDREWDFQYASLWITEEGGGVFKDVWSASPYAEAGLAITSTRTPGRMYCISLEHHVRSELKMRDVENWAFYAFQTEEEKAEGLEAQPIEMVNCRNILFGNLWLFRVVYVYRPFPQAIQVWNCRDLEFANVHSYTQMQYVFDNLIYDPAKKLTVLPWEAALVRVTGEEPSAANERLGDFEKIAGGLEFAAGPAVDSKGNLVFCDAIHKRIYRWLACEKRLELLCDVHWAPLCAVFDSEDQLAIVADMTELRTTVPGQPPVRRGRREPHPYFMWFGERGPRVYTFDTADPYNTMKVIEKTPKCEASPRVIYHPAHAWTPWEFTTAAVKPIDSYYLLPDGQTAIAGVKDIGRSLLLSPAVPGKQLLVVDDAVNRTYTFDVAIDGSLENPRIYAENGRYGVLALPDGSVLAPDGYLYIFNDGQMVKRLRAPERAVCAAMLRDGVALVGRRSVWIWRRY